MTGTASQIEWAEEIKIRVNTEFDRVANALEGAAGKQADAEDQADTRAIITILEDKRAEVLANERAGYFIVEWQELRDQVRLLIAKDSRYEAIGARKGSTILKENKL